MENSDYKSKITTSLSKFLPNIKIIDFEALTPDASARRYFRLKLDTNINSNSLITNKIIAMYFISTNSPESGASLSISSDQAVLSLGRFFNDNGMAVPQIFFEDLDNSLIFIEDLGSTSLADKFIETKDLNYYKKAIDQLKILQSIKVDDSYFAFQRKFTFKQYRNEMDEILDFYLELNDEERKNISIDLDKIAKNLENLPTVLVHRDYHSWNLMIDDSNKLRVIDYQDALIATPYYDLVALINDRDTDSILQQNNYIELLRYYFDVFKKPKSCFNEFLLVSLQRDLKVVGRFAKLDRKIFGANYSKWIPGTMRRIARTLNYFKAEYINLYQILYSKQSHYFNITPSIDLNKFYE